MEARSARILVVENDYGLAPALRTGLERQGFNVTAFETSDKVLSNFRINNYDLALLDMPEMEGFQLARELIEIDPNLAICFLTAYGAGFEDLFRKQFSTLPSYCFIKKPVTIAEIANVIRRVLGR